jgi:MFS family permease
MPERRTRCGRTGVADTEPVGTGPPTASGGRAFAWAVFLLSFALLLCDYMARSVLVPAFPVIQREWGLSDTQLGSLTGVVALAVGVLAVPLSFLGDRVGRVRAVQTMALLWSVATLACALAAGYGQLLGARVLLGVGEAAYGSVGLAVVLAVFPPTRRAALTGTFLAGATIGAALGVALGGILTTRLGWRWSFAVVALLGLALVALHRLLVSDRKLARYAAPVPGDAVPEPAAAPRAPLTGLVRNPSLVCAYLGSGLQLFAAGALLTWLPTHLRDGYGMSTADAGLVAAAVIVGMSLGMVACGWASDRLSRRLVVRRWSTAVAFSLASLVFLGSAFALGPGGAQLPLLALGAFFVAGPASGAGALVARLAPESIRATALGGLALANNLLGLAAGPFVVGLLADRLGVVGAMRLAPFVSVPAVVVLLIGRRLDTGRRVPSIR